MQMGKYLLSDLGHDVNKLNHTNFIEAKSLVEQHSEDYYKRATNDIKKALQKLYCEPEVSLQQLSATFRRGDLIEKLELMAESNE
jgi:hypothetical protein